eukprot:9172201-Ditylum_brightwellii.AAC.1
MESSSTARKSYHSTTNKSTIIQSTNFHPRNNNYNHGIKDVNAQHTVNDDKKENNNDTYISDRIHQALICYPSWTMPTLLDN